MVHKSETVFADDNSHRGIRTASGEPITPADQKSRIFADSPARKIVLPAAAWNQRAELCHRRRANECIRTAQNPDTEKHPGIWEPCSHVSWCSNDTRGDCIANSRGYAKPDAENLQQPATVLCGLALLVGRCVGSSGQ